VTHRLSFWRVALSLVSGLALALAYPNYNLPLLGWVSVAGLLYACIGASVAEAALCGFCYDAVYYGVSIPWVATVLQQYGPMPLWLAAGIFALLVIALSLFCAAFAGMFAWMARRSLPLALVAAPFLWVAMELARMHLPQATVNFPWDLLGYTASGSLALVQITAVTGIYGLSWLVVSYNALLVWALRAPAGNAKRRAAGTWAIAAVALIGVAIFGGRLVPRAQPTNVAHLVQTNLPQALDYPANWDQIHAGDVAQLDDISVRAGNEQPGLLVWPEVPAPFSMEQTAFLLHTQRLALDSHSDFLFGEVEWKVTSPGRRSPYNSAAMIAPYGDEVFEYDKMHLVPFGEFIPWRDSLWFARNLTAVVGDFSVGQRHSVGSLAGGKFGVFICYEAIFPEHVRQFVLNGAGMLLNLSNDGWFGRTAAPAQHLLQARVRAVENRRWLLRDTNNGYTVSIDPYGRIVARMPADVRGVLEAPYAFRTDRTIYTSWGDWFPWLSLVVSGCFVIAAALCGKSTAEARASGSGRAGKSKKRR